MVLEGCFFGPVKGSLWTMFPKIDPVAQPVIAVAAPREPFLSKQGPLTHGPVAPVVAHDDAVVVYERRRGCALRCGGGEVRSGVAGSHVES